MAVGAGLPNLMLRHASQDLPGAAQRVGWLWRHAIIIVLIFCVVAAVAGLRGSTVVRDVGLAVAGLLAQRVSSAGLKAGGRPNAGVLLDTALYPVVVMIFAFNMVATFGSLSIQALRLSFVGAVWAAAILALLLGWRSDGSVRTAISAPRRPDRPFYSEILKVTAGATGNVVATNSALTLAPLFLTDNEVGSLGLALRVAGYATTILVALSAYFGPAFARAATKNELLTLRRQSQYACTLLYVPVPALILLLPARWLESVGAGFESVKVLVLTLALGYLVNAGTGLTPSLLIMRGWSKAFSVTSVVGAVLTVTGVALGGMLGGALGIAFGLSATMAVTNVWIFYISSQKIERMSYGSPACSGEWDLTTEQLAPRSYPHGDVAGNTDMARPVS